MKWLVGLDLLPDSRGAVEFCKWLAERGAIDSPGASGLVVVEELSFFPPRGDTRARIEAGVREAGRAYVDSFGAAPAFGTIDAVIAPSIVETLASTARTDEAVLILGRQARRDDHPWVRLGRVARKMLRRLPVPVVVVPPDLEKDAIGDGPVLCTIDTDAHSLAAVRFARELARAVGRELELAHALPTLTDIGLGHLSREESESLRQEHAKTARRALDVFIETNGLDELRCRTLAGPVIETLEDIATEARACILVCGSRRLGTVERIFVTSTGSELAAYAPIPVMVVPASW